MEGLIEELRAAGFGLGGSRRMAEKYPKQVCVGPETDWDFYCDDDPAKRQWLAVKGFLKVEAEDRTYWDDLLVDIFKHREYAIEVLVRKSSSIYKSSFESLSAEVFMERLWKSSPLADPNISKAMFRRQVCDYFNGIFRLHGYQGDKPDDLPF